MAPKRFRVALSFPGEHRPFVAEVASALAQQFGREHVLYDQYHTAELARPNLAIYLPPLYHDESALIVAFLCAAYEHKEWCGLEWRAILDVLKSKQASAIMLMRFDDTDVPGLYSIDGYVDLTDRTSTEAAPLILQRLALLDAEHRAPSTTSTSTSVRIAPSRLPATGEHWVGRDDELALLDRAWDEPRTNVVVIVAPGGIGKTSLVQRWRQRLAEDGFRGAAHVYDWSFYSQGVRDTEVSADGFFDETLRWFGDADPTRLRGPWEKGERLAALIKQQRTLLVLVQAADSAWS